MAQHQEEQIQGADKLYYHIAKNDFAPYFDYDDVPLGAFTPQGNDGLSVNWEKYCQTALVCLSTKTLRYPEGRTAQTHGVGHFIASDVLTIDSLSVVHAPSVDNRAHSLIMGLPPSKPKPPFNQMRKELKRIFNYWDIAPEK